MGQQQVTSTKLQLGSSCSVTAVLLVLLLAV
jgi:hypothetical protein